MVRIGGNRFPEFLELEIFKMVMVTRDRDRDHIARDYYRDRDQRLGLQITNRLYWNFTI
jgi:hypothetical protein